MLYCYCFYFHPLNTRLLLSMLKMIAVFDNSNTDYKET